MILGLSTLFKYKFKDEVEELGNYECQSTKR